MKQKQQTNMRKAEFTVPQDVMVEFCDELTNHNLTNEIAGTTEDNEIVIEVLFEKGEGKIVDALEVHLEKLCEGLEKEEEEEETED